MITLFHCFVFALAIGEAEGNLHKGKPTDAYFGHTDPCVLNGTCSDRFTNRGMFSQQMKDYNPRIEKGMFDAIYKIAVDMDNKGLSLWEALNAIDVYIQSPSALYGWDDDRSKGVGFLELSHLEDMSKRRAASYYNTDGVNESWTDGTTLLADQKRRVDALRSVFSVHFVDI